MVKPRNDKKRLEILHSAVRLFRRRGYHATSYQDIADEVGESRALVQYYFPKKTDFAIIFFDAMGTCIPDILSKRGMMTKEKYVNFFLIGQVHFAYLAQNESTKKFVSDILDDRGLSDRIMFLTTEMSHNYLRDDDSDFGHYFDVALVRGGGLLTYIHYWILKDHEIETEPIIKENVQERMMQAGIPANVALSMLEPHRIPKREMQEILDELDEALSVKLDDEACLEFAVPEIERAFE